MRLHRIGSYWLERQRWCYRLEHHPEGWVLLVFLGRFLIKVMVARDNIGYDRRVDLTGERRQCFGTDGCGVQVLAAPVIPQRAKQAKVITKQ